MVTPPSNRTIAERIRSSMDSQGVSEVVLADETSIPRTTLRRRLAGDSDWMTGELTKISARLGVSLLDLLADEVAA